MKSLLVLLAGLMVGPMQAFSEDSSIKSEDQLEQESTEASVAGPNCKECIEKMHPDPLTNTSRERSVKIVQSTVNGTGDVVPLEKKDSEKAPGTK